MQELTTNTGHLTTNVDDIESLAIDELQELLTLIKHESVFLNRDMLDLQEKANIVQNQIQKLTIEEQQNAS